MRCHILAGSPQWVKVGGHIYIKGVTVRFGFDAIRTSQLPNVCQEQSNGDASWGVSYIYSPYWLMAYCREFIGGTIYLHRRGAFSVARFGR